MENTTSDEWKIDKLAAALSKAQAKLKSAKKTQENPFFKSAYADLTDVWDACRGPLTENGLAVTQTTRVSDEGNVTLITWLLHESGQKICSEYPVLNAKKDAQGLGGGMTYARRYALMAIVGVAAEDDDGNAASGNHDRRPPLQQIAESKQGPRDEAEFTMSEAQYKRLIAIAKKNGWEPEHCRAYMFGAFGKNSSQELNYAEYQLFTKHMENNRPGEDATDDKSEEFFNEQIAQRVDRDIR